MHAHTHTRNTFQRKNNTLSPNASTKERKNAFGSRSNDLFSTFSQYIHRYIYWFRSCNMDAALLHFYNITLEFRVTQKTHRFLFHNHIVDEIYPNFSIDIYVLFAITYQRKNSSIGKYWWRRATEGEIERGEIERGEIERERNTFCSILARTVEDGWCQLQEHSFV